ncbi:MAG: hypothetical protein JNL60_10765 [Bacteroidia bacterium]|nr:hypothetical protein [Bacteroidia bacterium]
MKSLSDLDKAYGKLNKLATIAEKLNYCTSVIRKAENLVTNEGPKLSYYAKKKSFALIIAAEEEIKKLSL